MGLRLIIAIIAGKMAIFFSRLVGNQGTDFPGRLARKICPTMLIDLAAHIQKDIIIVTGTNGKTTTSNMIAGILHEKGAAYVHNQAGANMLTGITTAFIQATNLSGRRSFDYALLETDEANVSLLLREIKVDVLLITNFFRDQLDRFGELDYTVNLIKNALPGHDMELLLNADDPLQNDFALHSGLKSWYYGFADTVYDQLSSNDQREGRNCVFCGHKLDYKRYHYAQLGQYSCPHCANHNPEADYVGHRLQMDREIRFSVNQLDLHSSYQGFHNAYNILAAVAMGLYLNIDDDAIQRAIYNYQPHAGRLEKFIINGKPCLLILVKNPTGLNQSLNMLTLDHARKNLFFALNDNAADGRDISWIWEADWETIVRPEVGLEKIICSGLRSGEVALRAKYADLATERIVIESRLREGIALAVDDDAVETAVMLCTYTALFTCRRILLQLQGKKAAIQPSGQQDYRPKQRDKGMV